jgi:salicylate hydroxylase
MTRYPIRKGTVVNCAAFVSADTWTGEGWSQRCSVEELQALFAGWHGDVLGLAANAPLEGTAKWALYDRDPLEIWVQGRVALLGDAAHPMLPFLGLGAAMGIEDAVVLGRAFGETEDTCTALLRYQSARSARAGLMLLESRRQGQLFRDGPEGTTQRTVTTHSQRMAYDPSTAPL